jgi:hypothetical protein
MSEWLTYIDHLQRKNADDLAFYPLTTLEKALDEGHVLKCEENGQPGGYLWFGAVRPGYDVTIYQACIDYDLRRQHLGFGMVAELVALAKAGAANGIRLKCASSALSNTFWNAAGFYVTNVTQGGKKRGRDINHYRTDVTAPLFVVDSVEASVRPIDLTAYNRAKAAGEQMPSRFSRTHYGGVLEVDSR